MPNRIKELYGQVIFERRILLACTLLVGLSVCIWAVAIGTDHWLSAKSTLDNSVVVEDAGPNGTKIFLWGYSGLFRTCNIFMYTAGTDRAFKECSYRELEEPMEPKPRHQRIYDNTLIQLSRTQVSFAIISTFVMAMGFGFSIYTFRNPRYMFKRLAGGIHFITCACALAVIQVTMSSLDYGMKKALWIFPKGAEVSYDYSMILACLASFGNAMAGCAFMGFSRKRKRDKAPNDELAMADEPTIIGR